MPGMTITDQQHRNKLSQVASAAKAGISERSARHIEGGQSLPSQRPQRNWRTRATNKRTHPGVCEIFFV